MLVQLSVSNFLSFDHKETFSMVAGKARKDGKRIYKDKKNKITKCAVVLGANASGKSNLIGAFQFIQDMVADGLQRGFSNKYYRMRPECKGIPSEFEIEILLDKKRYCYTFSVLLSKGSIVGECLRETTRSDSPKLLFSRNVENETFEVGSFFKNADAISKLKMYGEDSVSDQETLYLNIINKNKSKMFAENPELMILRKIFIWIVDRLNISFPESILTGYPYFADTNLEQIADILHALGTGISELKIVEIPFEAIKNKIPDEFYNKIITNLEKANAKKDKEKGDRHPSIMLRSYKEFYTFEIDDDNQITIKTIEFSHENRNVFFDLKEESDGTARLLDLIEILLDDSSDHVYVIDEIDRCLHPVMTVKIIELFLQKAVERNAQLIITSHESRLLAAEILRNDEICFVKKNEYGASTIVPMEKYQLRADKKVYAALFDGTIDAIPHFDDKKLGQISLSRESAV